MYFNSHNKNYIHSALNINKYLYLDDVENGKQKVDSCNNKDNGVFEYVSNGLIKSPLSLIECLGKGERNNDSSNTKSGYLKLCDKTDVQKWGSTRHSQVAINLYHYQSFFTNGYVSVIIIN